MPRFIHFIISLLFSTVSFQTVSAQLTFKVSQVPNYYMPLWDQLYVAGSFNGWQPGNSAYSLALNPDGNYYLTINVSAGNIQFKFTRGNWPMGETQANGAQLPNRLFSYNGGIDTVICSIAAWEDFPPGIHTATSNVKVLDGNMLMPQLNRQRRVWIYLPTDYGQRVDSFRVVYMMDGQNVFDAATSFSGEWGVDDTLRQYQLMGDSGAIVVAVDNGGSLRLAEYCPYVNLTYGGGQGDAFADFVALTLKPAIDSAFRTKPDRWHTAIAGSSMGAYIALYTALKYQNVFSKVASLSPAYWYHDSIYHYASLQGMQQGLRIYQVCSVNEGASVVTNQNAMRDTLISNGFMGNDVKSISQNYGGHNEGFWRSEFGPAYRWLFESIPANFNEELTNHLTVFPNPANGLITVKSVLPIDTFHISLVDLLGRDFTPANITIVSPFILMLSVGQIPAGNYVLKLTDVNGKSIKQNIVLKH
jgi:predicted alpha/beta superfamily hydrolase